MKKMLIGVTIIILIVIAVFLFRQPISVPSSFLTEERLKKEIKAVYNYSNLSEVQDIVFLDDRNVFVPLIFENGNYGMSTWKWNPSKKWELQSFDSHGSPQLLNIGDDDQRYFIWNMPPVEYVAGVNIYLIRDRNAWISGYIPVYLPRIQLEQHVPFDGKGYGVLKMPKEWVSLTNQLSENEAGRTDQLFSNMFSQNDQVLYGWRTVDHSGNLKLIEMNNSSGHGFSQSSAISHMVLPLYEGEVEFGK